MKIGIFRGSFDPPHMGHVFSAVYALQTMELNQIWIMPVFNHPFGKKLSDFRTRIEMCELSFRGFGNTIHVKDADKNSLDGHCITLLKHLKSYYNPTHQYIMLGGTDVDSKQHKDKEEILKLCTVARVPRSEYSDNKYAIPNYSSSEIKQLVKDGKSIEGLVSREVEKYIQEKGLYKG